MKKKPTNAKNIKNKKRKKKKMKLWKKILLVILLLLAILLGWFFYKSEKNGGGLSGMLATIAGHDENTRKNLGEFRCLILGISTDQDGVDLTDTIMIASYNPNTQKATLLSHLQPLMSHLLCVFYYIMHLFFHMQLLWQNFCLYMYLLE